MQPNRIRLLSAAVFSLAISVSSGLAQDDSLGDMGDLGIRVRKQHLDSYWLENRKWEQYGYRPHTLTHLQHFTSMPSYSAGKDYYSYGETLPGGTAAEIDAATQKQKFQLTKYGTWH